MRRINRCFNHQLHHLCQGAVELDVLSRAILKFLPKTLHGHCQVASFNRGCLLLTINKPNLATELRYLLPNLRDDLRKEAKLHQLISIKLRILADHYPLEPMTQKKRQSVLSSTAEATLKALRSTLAMKTR